MENHQASLDRLGALYGLRVVHPLPRMDEWLPLNLTTLPPEIGKCTNLRQLDIDSSQLTTLPQELFQLTRLTILSLSHNQITTIPAQIGQLTNLISLFLGGNQQLGALPKEIGQLTRLQFLILSHITITPQQKPSQLRLIADSCTLDRSLGAFKEGKTEEALKMFKELPTDTKNAIYEELHKILSFQQDYHGCVECAFLQYNGQRLGNKKRIRAIKSFINR